VTATKAFLSALDGLLQQTVEYDFTDNRARQSWSYVPATTSPRPGVALADLTGYQQTAALAVLQVALSGSGNQQDSEIQRADDYLASLGDKDADDFGALKDYAIAVYGAPSMSSPFMIQFSGHHLARNLTYNGDSVSQTPQFLGSEPASFSEAGTTVEPLRVEASALFAVVSALTKDQKKSAEITSGSVEDLMMGPDEDSGTFPAPEGLSVADLDAGQRQLVLAAINSYAGDLSTSPATKLLAKYRSELDQTTIGWANGTGPTEAGNYIRIDGPSVWIEFTNLRGENTRGVHFHTVYRDKANDYGSSKPTS